MDKEQQVRELQEKINSLAKDIHSFQHELSVLQAELNALKGEATAIVQSKISEQAPVTGHATPPGTNASLENYIGLRFMHIVGIIVLVVGLSIGVKYAIDKQLISEAMRIILAYAAGAILFGLSVRLKKKYDLFSAILFSGSMASIYFTTYAAFVYYQFFPVAVAFGIMTLLTIYTALKSISYDRQEIAILGMIGAYGIPFLISANAERVDLFFSYILLINIGVAFISFRKTWRIMRYMALVITWVLFIGWSFMRFDPSERLMGFVFMSAYYLLFLVSAIASRINRSAALLPGQIQQVIINNIALYLSSLLIFGDGAFDLNMAVTTGYMALFIALLAYSSWIFLPGELTFQRLLAWQAIILLTGFIGLRWDGLTVTLSWIGLAVLLFIWGIYNKRSWPRLAAIILIGVTLVKLIAFDSANFSTVQKIISFIVIGVLLLLFSFYYQKFNLISNKAEQKS